MGDGQTSRLRISDDGAITTVEFVDRNILDEGNIQQIGEELARLIESKPDPRLLLNFSNVDHLSSAALGTLIQMRNKINNKGGKLALSNIDPQIYEVFKITRLVNLFDIYDNAEKALAELG